MQGRMVAFPKNRERPSSRQDEAGKVLQSEGETFWTLSPQTVFLELCKALPVFVFCREVI
jgi:hypothetical protein